MDAVENHKDCLFLMFNDGTLINQETARRLGKLGNLTPALSVEGLGEQTDQRRGAGIHESVLEAMAHLREVGVPFGISMTATPANCELILSDLSRPNRPHPLFVGFVRAVKERVGLAESLTLVR